MSQYAQQTSERANDLERPRKQTATIHAMKAANEAEKAKLIQQSYITEVEKAMLIRRLREALAEVAGFRRELMIKGAMPQTSIANTQARPSAASRTSGQYNVGDNDDDGNDDDEEDYEGDWAYYSTSAMPHKTAMVARTHTRTPIGTAEASGSRGGDADRTSSRL